MGGRLCGSIFQVDKNLGIPLTTVCDCTAPFTVGIKTNDGTDGPDNAQAALVMRGVSDARSVGMF